MKKFSVSLLCTLLCFLLCVPCFACADAKASASGESGVLPDPADFLEQEGTLYAEDYNFDTDFICSVYTYEPADDDFLGGYLTAAKINDFELSQTTVEGYEAYRLEYEDLAALLLPDCDGVMMLLVQNGMAFGGSLPEYSARDGGPWLPDPCTALNVSGEFNQRNTEDNGVTYDFYTYDFTADYETVSHFIVTYTEALKNMGYTSKKLKQTGNSVWYQQYVYGDNIGAELGIFVSSGAEEISNGGEGGWRVVLAVPEGYSFIPGNGAPGVVAGNTVCVGCGGSGKCVGCGGTGIANYGDGYETCVICDGNGICNVCDGEGSY